MPSASATTAGSAIECLHDDVAASQPLTRRVGGRCCHGTRRIRGPPPCTPQGRCDGAASDVLRDRCLNCLSYTHRLTTCRMPLWCLRCRAFWHLARDCKRPRSPENSSFVARTAGSLFNYHVDVGSEWTKVCPVSWSLGVREILETLFESLTAPTPNRIPCRNDVCWKNDMQPH